VRFIRDLRQLLRHRNFRRLYAVRLMSQFGDGVFQVALASYVLFDPQRQPSPEAIAATFATLLLPYSLLGPFAGVLLDRWSRRQVLVYTNLIRALPMLAFIAVVATNVTGPLLYAPVLAILSLNRFFLAALSAGLPHVVDPDELLMANAVTPTSGTFAYMIGLAAGTLIRGVAKEVSGQADVIVLSVALLAYLLASGLATRMARMLLGPDFDPNLPAVREAVRHVMLGLVAGARHIRERRDAAYGLAAIGAQRFWYGISTVATILLYRNTFYDPSDTDAGLAGLSIAVLVTGVGFLTAALLTPSVSRRLGKRRWIVMLLAIAAFVQIVPGAFYTVPTLLVAAYVLGIVAQGIKICVDTIVQESVDDAFRGRVFSIYDVIFNVSFVAAAAVAGLVVPLSGKSYPVVFAVAIGYAITCLGYAWLAIPRLAQEPPMVDQHPPSPFPAEDDAFG
jgi:MFS family permease